MKEIQQNILPNIVHPTSRTMKKYFQFYIPVKQMPCEESDGQTWVFKDTDRRP